MEGTLLVILLYLFMLKCKVPVLFSYEEVLLSALLLRSNILTFQLCCLVILYLDILLSRCISSLFIPTCFDSSSSTFKPPVSELRPADTASCYPGHASELLQKNRPTGVASILKLDFRSIVKHDSRKCMERGLSHWDCHRLTGNQQVMDKGLSDVCTDVCSKVLILESRENNTPG